MCGIAGFSIATGECGFDRSRLAAILLAEIEPRGRDAAGIAWRAAGTGKTWYQKDAVKGSVFARRMHHGVGNAAAAVLHTRFATKGSVDDERNNHPIIRDGVCGVHNGVIVNDDEVFRLLGDGVERRGQVDSEAIFALIENAPTLLGDGDHVGSLLGLLSGSMAVAWLPTGERELWLARGSGSPLYAGRTERGSLIFASTEMAIRRASLACGIPVRKILPVAEGTVLRVVGGRVTDRWTFTPDSGGVRPRSYGNGRSTLGTVGGRQTGQSAPPKSRSKRKHRKTKRQPRIHDVALPEGTVVGRWNDSTRLDWDRADDRHWLDEVYYDSFAATDDWDDEEQIDTAQMELDLLDDHAAYFDRLRAKVRGERA